MTSIPPMNPGAAFTSLRPAAQKIVTDYVLRRGIAPRDLTSYLNPQLTIELHGLPDARKFADRLERAVANRERVLIYGDYDADGITSVTILLRFLRETKSFEPDWALPNRQRDDYGLDLSKAKDIFARFRPSLLICLDCGTNSVEAIEWLKAQGVDTLVADHHPAELTGNAALAVVNPKTHGRNDGDLCSAGIAFHLCHDLAADWHCMDQWDRPTATILAGLGTLADAVAMTQVNRGIIKTALTLINDRCCFQQCPGLAALIPAGSGWMNQRRLQFEVVPPLNALGRLESPDPGVKLFLTSNQEEAAEIVEHAREVNETRKSIQRGMVQQAAARARVVLAHQPSAPVLILADHRWHHGVAGPAASNLVEMFGRNTILLAPQGVRRWKGSGRSDANCDLGLWIRHVKHMGLVDRGGGHSGAIGLGLTNAQIAALQTAGLVIPTSKSSNQESENEIVGDTDQLDPEEWLRVLELLEPFGKHNPFPRLSVAGAICTGNPAVLTAKESGQVWAVKADFRTKQGQKLSVLWRDFDRALTCWRPGKLYNLELELTAKAFRGRLVLNWIVTSCRSVTDIRHGDGGVEGKQSVAPGANRG